MGEQADAEHGQPQGYAGRDQRQQHGEERSEGKQDDDRRGDQAYGRAAGQRDLGGRLGGVTADLDLQAGVEAARIRSPTKRMSSLGSAWPLPANITVA